VALLFGFTTEEVPPGLVCETAVVWAEDWRLTGAEDFGCSFVICLVVVD